jgi:hypothetical protein
VDESNEGLSVRSGVQEGAVVIRQGWLSGAEHVEENQLWAQIFFPPLLYTLHCPPPPFFFMWTCGMNTFATPQQLTGAGGGSVGLDLGSSWAT